MTKKASEQTPPEKAKRTAKWAKTMTKVEITKAAKGGVQWRVIEFNGPKKIESRGIVDIMAIRKDHTSESEEYKRGDIFEIILIQAKGGFAKGPTEADRKRLNVVRKKYGAKHVVLASWKKGRKPTLRILEGDEWSAPRKYSFKDVFFKKSLSDPAKPGKKKKVVTKKSNNRAS